jgi:hypothetical protein
MLINEQELIWQMQEDEDREILNLLSEKWSIFKQLDLFPRDNVTSKPVSQSSQPNSFRNIHFRKEDYHLKFF